jgi:FkbM family methyltransferase
MLQVLPQKIAQRLLNLIHGLMDRGELLDCEVSTRNDLKQIGTKYGGWVVPTDLLDANSICYCVGCGEDISFDLGLIDEFNCHIFGFDPTPRAIDYVKKKIAGCDRYHFFDVGLWDQTDILKFYVPKNRDHVSHSVINLQKTSDYFEAKVDRLSQIMQANGHHHLDLLKLDIEGAEYKVIQSILQDQLDIKILCIEYDECFNPLDRNYKQRVRESVNSLINAGYTLVCIQQDGNYTFVKEK